MPNFITSDKQSIQMYGIMKMLNLKNLALSYNDTNFQNIE